MTSENWKIRDTVIIHNTIDRNTNLVLNSVMGCLATSICHSKEIIYAATLTLTASTVID